MSVINRAVCHLYKNRKYGELSALYKLFHERVGEAIKAELSQTLQLRNSEREFDKVYVDLNWIDKIPLASFVNKQLDLNGNEIKNKTELGDMFIQFRQSCVYIKDNQEDVHPIGHKALVVQAKISSVDNPKVPIGYVNKKRANSTSKELKLLEDWPTFDMYETSRNSQALCENISVQTGTVPFSFYGGFSNKSKSWFFGEAKNLEVCEKTFSEIIVDLAKGKIGKEVKSDKAWNDVTSHITQVCKNRKLPKSIANKIETRHKEKKIHGRRFYSFPEPLFYLIHRVWEKLLAFICGKKMLVISIDVVRYEGQNLNLYR
ncbi:hypothetical protein ND926_18800 [Vibrio diabolicus]|uniref:hypothetical protein n=1 Tax=Vibrio TaxID=662 RepID=UPI00211A7EB4|nr:MULTISPECIES: hypothetical protein [Vibrio]EHD0130070.1 hypothetical protein [Vibrio alginolyticus]EIJ2379661.1 hypothetical protein [Vibrio alginolyticus]EKZ9011427.1 hypothetical protein [Vibrio alginolyticus]MCQ9100245.1 hypothetical protein [Vibrio parahaemolyticus]MCR9505801.1 hypothetical protein [Vibrio alginolyticus]